MKTTLAVAVSLALLSRGPARADGPGSLRQLSNALSQLADKVSPAVVQVIVSGYGPTSVDERHTDTAFIARQRGIGSGIIVDPAGYIVTNAHVVEGAQRVLVLLASTSSGQARRQAMKKGVFKASVVGVHREADLAVLKIDAERLPAISLRDLPPVKQGELVIAVGSPQGLASSMTMGVVSAPAREPDLDVPMLFVQTDAPVNPGNSGGPLINADGDLVGINTFILSRSGGSQGLGFAIPVNVVRFVYEGLRKNGRVDRVELGIRDPGRPGGDRRAAPRRHHRRRGRPAHRQRGQLDDRALSTHRQAPGPGRGVARRRAPDGPGSRGGARPADGGDARHRG